MGIESTFLKYPLYQQLNTLYLKGDFIVAIRYYGYKINLYQLGTDLIEVFINHKKGIIERIDILDKQHSRMKFYCDQIKLPRL
jgi:hypothetical protein